MKQERQNPSRFVNLKYLWQQQGSLAEYEKAACHTSILSLLTWSMIRYS